MGKSIFKKTHIFPDDIVINILGFINQNGPMLLSYDFKQKKFVDTKNPDYTYDKECVQENGLWLKNVRKKLQTEEMCRLAFLQNSKAIKYVRKKLIKEKLLKSELYKKQPYLFILNSFGIVRYNLKTKKFEETIEFGYRLGYFILVCSVCFYVYIITILLYKYTHKNN
jgi:hypothetical protein